MKISINCKLDSNGALGFIKPIEDIEEINKILVFRDNEGLLSKKIIYVSPPIKKPALLVQFFKLIQMLFSVSKDTALSIGIYEIPHGLFANIIGKLRGIPTVLCFIADPAYRIYKIGLRKIITYFIFNSVDKITVTGSKSKEILINNGIDGNKIHILPNSIDINYYSPMNIKKEFDIINLGRLSKEKELIIFLHVIYQLTKIYPDLKVGIGGKGPEKETIESKIAELRLENNLVLLGYVKDSMNFYNKGKLFVHTSSTEGLPRTVIEAMACGVPCVASNVGDMEDIVKDGVNGFLVNDYRDIDGFTDKIRTLLSDSTLYESFSDSAAEQARSNYSYEAATAVWHTIITDIFEKRARDAT